MVTKRVFPKIGAPQNGWFTMENGPSGDDCNLGRGGEQPKKHLVCCPQHSEDSWMYPYQRTPMGNPYVRPI